MCSKIILYIFNPYKVCFYLFLLLLLTNYIIYIYIYLIVQTKLKITILHIKKTYIYKKNYYRYFIVQKIITFLPYIKKT